MAVKGGNINVATAGTRVQFSATRNVFCSLTVQSDPENANYVYIGDSSVSSSNFFIKLGPGDSLPLISSEGDSINLQNLWADAAVNDEDVNFIGVAR